jgi:hypothetical protein
MSEFTLDQLREQVRGAVEQPANLDEVTVYGGLEFHHVEGPVDYLQSPPVGGPHAETWWDCGVYDEPIRDENAVHSLEHGTTWITWRDLDRNEVDRLAGLLPANGILSPYPDQAAPVVVTVWGRQLELTGPDDARLELFIRQYGDPLFTQAFLKLSNVRAILHQGVGHWIDSVLQSREEIRQTPLFEDLESGELNRKEAERWLSLVFESILDHHAEFLDYNSTTTQSDRGDLIYMFHDFLRLRVRYDRVAWNLKPVFWAHEILVRSRFEDAAAIWRRSLSERIGSKADIYVTKLRSLQREYAMRMPTVADRILERFVQPMTIDRMRALVEPATRDAEANRPSGAFDLLQREADLLTQHPTGVGLDMPVWLAALEEEVEMVAKRHGGNEVDVMSLVTMPIRPLDREDLRGQLNAARRQGRRERQRPEEPDVRPTSPVLWEPGEGNFPWLPDGVGSWKLGVDEDQ